MHTAAIEKQISEATDKALERFWRAIAESFPKAQSGDLDPLAVDRLENAANAAVSEWVRANLKVYTVHPGRSIYRNGIPWICIHKEDETKPTDADSATHLIAALLNVGGA